MIWESVRIALRSLRAAKLRSFLTMLGVIIGVASVLAVVAVGAGARAQIAEQIRSLGTNVFMIYTTGSATGASGGSSEATGVRQRPLREDDVRALAEQIPLIEAAAPFGWSSVQIIRGNRNASTALWGTTADYFGIRSWPLTAGRLFTPDEEAGSGKQLIIGARLARRLFGFEDPIGAEVRIDSVPFQIIGVLAERGVVGGTLNPDEHVFAPISTASRRLRGSIDEVYRDAVDYIVVKVVSESRMAEAKAQIESLLRQRFGGEVDREASFRVSDPAAQLTVQQDTTRTFAWLLTSVASISLVVGGISIMNIMLVSVTERTREIGLRLAIGARRRDVRNQFLMEAVTLCLSGGLLGIALGVLATAIISEAAGWPVYVGLDAVVLALGFALITGIFFGWYPARKASYLQPVEALRSE
jgi:putative ABC transport system permease protein